MAHTPQQSSEIKGNGLTVTCKADHEGIHLQVNSFDPKTDAETLRNLLQNRIDLEQLSLTLGTGAIIISSQKDRAISSESLDKAMEIVRESIAQITPSTIAASYMQWQSAIGTALHKTAIVDPTRKTTITQELLAVIAPNAIAFDPEPISFPDEKLCEEIGKLPEIQARQIAVDQMFGDIQDALGSLLKTKAPHHH